MAPRGQLHACCVFLPWKPAGRPPPTSFTGDFCSWTPSSPQVSASCSARSGPSGWPTLTQTHCCLSVSWPPTWAFVLRLHLLAPPPPETCSFWNIHVRSPFSSYISSKELEMLRPFYLWETSRPWYHAPPASWSAGSSGHLLPWNPQQPHKIHIFFQFYCYIIIDIQYYLNLRCTV